MRYTMKSGILSEETAVSGLANVKSSVSGFAKTICKINGEPILKAEIRNLNRPSVHCGNMLSKEYLLLDRNGNVVAVGHPGCAKEHDPALVNRPACRLPKVDHAVVTIAEAEFLLTMHNSQNYSFQDAHGSEILRIVHKGISGGWNIEDNHGFSPEILCGIFVFCRYIEQENEFLIV